jgi:Protein of unknown function (DUF2782)
MQKIIFSLLLSIFAAAAIAQPAPPRVKPNNLEVVDTVEAPSKKETLPEDVKVTVYKKDGVTFEEYRLLGKHTKTRVTPASGPSYVLVDLKGDGNFVRSDGPETKGATAMWTILEW